jgi:hypothetical protein
MNDSRSDDEITEEINKTSYAYWKRESDTTFSDQFKPNKVEEIQTNNKNTNNTYGSAWNSAGTWEENHLKASQVEEFINSKIKDRVFDNTFVISQFNNYSGDVIKSMI